jgi:FkbM family methyltransferase
MILFAHWSESQSKVIITTGWSDGDSRFDIIIKDKLSSDLIFNGWVSIPKNGFTPISVDEKYSKNPSFSGLIVQLFSDGQIIYERNIDSKLYNQIEKHQIGEFEIYLRQNEQITSAIDYFNNFWEWDHMEQFSKYLDFTGKILDIGANIGNHTLMFRKYFPNTEILSFEPLFYNYELLQKNVSQLSDVHIFKVALSDKHDIIKIDNNFQEFNSGAASVSTTGESVLSIPLDALDLTDVSFMKIDVEGWEPQVIRGALKTIQTNRPKIWLEDGTGKTIDYMVRELNYFVEDQRGGENFLLSSNHIK